MRSKSVSLFFELRKSLAASLIVMLVLAVSSSKMEGQSLEVSNKIVTMDGVLVVKYKSAEYKNWILSTANSASSDLYSFKIASEKPLLENLDEELSLVTINFDSRVDPNKVAKIISKYPFVEYAEPKRLYPLAAHRTRLLDPDDPRYSDQGYLDRLGFDEAWDQVKGQDGEMVIAIIDGGTDWQHEDLIGNIWTNPNEIDGNGLDDDGNGFIDDVRGWNFANQTNDPKGLDIHPVNGMHGTETAGVAAASSNNGAGVSGSSWNAKLMPVNAGNDAPADGLIKFGYEAILYAAKAGADIINCSWGGQGDPLLYEQEIIALAVAEGALVVAAGGNVTGGENSRNNDLAFNVPANYTGVLSVGSTATNSDELASHSHFGVLVDVYAPGVNLITTAPNNRYVSATGTSFAAPLTAGLAAMVWTASPELGPLEVAEQIRNSAFDMNPFNNGNFQNLLGAGRIDPLSAVSNFSGSTIKINSTSSRDEDGDAILLSGEKLFVQLELEASINDVASGLVTLRTYQDSPFPYSQDQSIEGLIVGSPAMLEFEVTVPQNVVLNDLLRFRVDYIVNGRTLSELVIVNTKPPNVFNHSNGVLSLGITNEGNIGYIDENLSSGIGMAFYSDYILYEGGLLIGDASNRVSDSVRGDDGSTQDEDFKPVSNSGIVFSRPGPVAYEETRVRFDDSGASNPLEVSVVQESFLFNESGKKNFAIIRYSVSNESSTALQGVRVGLFMDFDLNSRFIDFIDFDESNRTGVVRNQISNSSIVAGVKLLNNDPGFSYVSLSNSSDLSSVTSEQKWTYLNSGIQTTNLDGEDVAFVISSAPTNFNSGESKEFGFSIWVASDLAEAEEVYQASQQVWDAGLFESDLPEEDILMLPYPNPFRGTINLNYEVATQGLVEVAIFDVLGRRVRELVKSNRGIGSYEVRWDGKSFNDVIAPSGIYFVRFLIDGNEIGSTKSIHKIN